MKKRDKHEAINNGWPCIGSSEEECDLPDGPCKANENWLVGEPRRAYRTIFTDKSESSSIGQDCAVLGWTKCEGQNGKTCGTGMQVCTLDFVINLQLRLLIFSFFYKYSIIWKGYVYKI